MGCGSSVPVPAGMAPEVFRAALSKQQRLFDRDIRRLELSAAEVGGLFAAFAAIDANGSGTLTEAKWTLFLSTNAREQKEREATALRKAAAAREAEERRKASRAGAAASQTPEAKAAALAAKKEAERARTPAELEAQRKADMAAAQKELDAQAALEARSTLPRRAYARRLFRIFARAGRAECDFGEFLCSAVEFLSPLPWALVHFAFSVYDTDGSGSLSLRPGACGGVGRAFLAAEAEARAKADKALADKVPGAKPYVPNAAEVNALEILHLAKEVLGAASAETRAAAARLGAQVERDTAALAASLFEPPAVPTAFGEVRRFRELDEAEFARFAVRNPSVLYPAFRLHEALVLRLGGERLFAGFTERRVAAAKADPIVLRAGLAFIASVPASVAMTAQQERAKAQRVGRSAEKFFLEGLEHVPHAINRLAGTVTMQGHSPFLEDYAPEADIKYLRLVFSDVLGKVVDFRRGRDADPKGLFASSSSGSKRNLHADAGAAAAGGGPLAALGKSKRNILRDADGGASSRNLAADPPGASRAPSSKNVTADSPSTSRAPSSKSLNAAAAAPPSLSRGPSAKVVPA